MNTTKLYGGTVHQLPKEIADEIAQNHDVLLLWNDITPLARNEWICWMTSAKQEKTRQRRVSVGMDKMSKGTRRPCCWAGCTHRVKSKKEL